MDLFTDFASLHSLHKQIQDQLKDGLLNGTITIQPVKEEKRQLEVFTTMKNHSRKSRNVSNRNPGQRPARPLTTIISGPSKRASQSATDIHHQQALIMQTQEVERQQVMKEAKKAISDYYAKKSEKTPYLEFYTAPPSLSELGILPSERFLAILNAFIRGILLKTTLTSEKILALEIGTIDQLKKLLSEFVEHEQRVKNHFMDLTSELTNLQVMISNNEAFKREKVFFISEIMLQVTRQLKATYHTAIELLLKQDNIYMDCIRKMYQIYSSLILKYSSKLPLKLEDYPLDTEIEAYQYSKPLISAQLNIVITYLEFVRSYIWVAGSNGEISIISRSRTEKFPRLKHLKSIKAHEDSINCLLFVETAQMSCVWSGSADRTLKIWSSETANQKYSLLMDYPIECMEIVKKNDKYYVWTVSTLMPQIHIWDFLTTRVEKTIPLKNDDKVKEKESKQNVCMVVTSHYVLLAKGSYINVFSFDGDLLLKWKAVESSQKIGTFIFTKNEQIWVTVGNTIRIWEIKLKTLTPILITDFQVCENDIVYISESNFENSCSSIIWCFLSAGVLLLCDAVTRKILRTVSVNPNSEHGKLMRPIDQCMIVAANASLKSDKYPSTILWFETGASFA